jgi:hypothetical protein
LGEYAHDYRGDEKWLTINGTEIPLDEHIVSGHSGKPLAVTQQGCRLLDTLLTKTARM